MRTDSCQIGYCLALCLAEIVALTSPPCIPNRRFPRFPSPWLALLEAVAIIVVAYSMVELLEAGFGHGDSKNPGPNRNIGAGEIRYPKATCVSPEEKLSIAAYGCQMVAL